MLDLRRHALDRGRQFLAGRGDDLRILQRLVHRRRRPFGVRVHACRPNCSWRRLPPPWAGTLADALDRAAGLGFDPCAICSTVSRRIDLDLRSDSLLAAIRRTPDAPAWRAASRPRRGIPCTSGVAISRSSLPLGDRPQMILSDRTGRLTPTIQAPAQRQHCQKARQAKPMPIVSRDPQIGDGGHVGILPDLDLPLDEGAVGIERRLEQRRRRCWNNWSSSAVWPCRARSSDGSMLSCSRRLEAASNSGSAPIWSGSRFCAVYPCQSPAISCSFVRTTGSRSASACSGLSPRPSAIVNWAMLFRLSRIRSRMPRNWSTDTMSFS